jgi:hypothetical protein
MGEIVSVMAGYCVAGLVLVPPALTCWLPMYHVMLWGGMKDERGRGWKSIRQRNV